MPRIADAMKSNAAYLFIAVGIAWLAVALFASSSLVLWPTIACVVGGVLLRLRPGERLTWAWTVSAAALGLVLSAYQVYAWAPFIQGAFSTVAVAAIGGFAVFAVVHLLLMYLGAAKPVK
jgi:hypothetical protein